MRAEWLNEGHLDNPDTLIVLQEHNDSDSDSDSDSEYNKEGTGEFKDGFNSHKHKRYHV